MKPPARAIAGNLVWSTDGGVWAVWRVEPFAHAHTAVADKLDSHRRLRGLLVALPTEAMLFSVCERIDPWDVVADMADRVDTDRHPDWARVCAATATELTDIPLHRRRHYVAAALPRAGAGGIGDSLRNAAHEITSRFGIAPSAISAKDLDAARREARSIETAMGSHVTVDPATAGEIRWLYARALRRGVDEPAVDQSWEPPVRSTGDGRHFGGVLAHLTDAVVTEGGSSDDPDRPRHRRYLRVDTTAGPAYQAVLALAGMPHTFAFPGGGGEWFYHLDELGFPIDWCVRLRSIPNSEAQAKVRRQHRQLIGQVDEYDGEVTGAPPSLAEAITAVDIERAELAANPAEPELHATVLFSVAADNLADLEDQARAVQSLFEPHEYGIGRPTGGQVALLRSMLPGTAAAPVCRDYIQFLLPRDLAGGAPFCGPDVGDPTGLLLGVSLDGGAPSPVLYDPTYGPSVGRTASLAAVGALGSGKSYFLKRMCWDTLARGGQVVTIDRTAVGEYVAFADVAPGDTQVVSLTTDSGVCLDPLRTFAGEDRVNVTLGFLSLLAGCSTHSEEGTVLAEAVHAVAADPDGTLTAVIDTLRAMADDPQHPDTAARGLARRLGHFRKMGVGQLAFGDGDPVSLDADFIVFWAPHLSLPDRDTLLNEHLARQMLPEQIVGHALIYLVAAVGRQVVFRDPSRFGAALYDEAWALLGSPHGQRLLLEGIRDGRKHNGAIWLASQHPRDLGTGELVDLLGARFVFRQSAGAVPAATGLLGVDPNGDAAVVLKAGLRPGQCLIRDVRDRVGLIQILEPVLPELRAAFDTTPRGPDTTSEEHDPQAVELAPRLDADADPEPSIPDTPWEPDHLEPIPEPSAEPVAIDTEPIDRGEAIEEPAPPAPTPVQPRRRRDAVAAREAARRRRRSPLAAALAEQTST